MIIARFVKRRNPFPAGFYQAWAVRMKPATCLNYYLLCGVAVAFSDFGNSERYSA